MPSRLAEAQIEAQARLRRLASSAVAGVWADLPGHDRANVDEWLSRVLPIVSTAQRTSVAFTEAYLAAALRRRPLGVNPADLIGAEVRGGVDPATVYERPFVTLWSKLGEGQDFETAAAAALARAKSTAAMDVQLSMRATSDAVERVDDGIYGFERVADPGACAFCAEVNGAYVKRADAMPLHNNCGCGLEPLTAPHRLAANLPSGVAVHQHGELGPVLGAAGHDFTSQSDI